MIKFLNFTKYPDEQIKLKYDGLMDLIQLPENLKIDCSKQLLCNEEVPNEFYPALASFITSNEITHILLSASILFITFKTKLDEELLNMNNSVEYIRTVDNDVGSKFSDACTLNHENQSNVIDLSDMSTPEKVREGIYRIIELAEFNYQRKREQNVAKDFGLTDD